MYFGTPCHTRDPCLAYSKAKFVCFIYMQQQKVEFTSVQINETCLIVVLQVRRIKCCFMMAVALFPLMKYIQIKLLKCESFYWKTILPR